MHCMAGQLSHCGKCCAYTESDFNDNCVKCGNVKGERTQFVIPKKPVSLVFDDTEEERTN
jgi:hypothetical protein